MSKPSPLPDRDDALTEDLNAEIRVDRQHLVTELT